MLCEYREVEFGHNTNRYPTMIKHLQDSRFYNKCITLYDANFKAP